MRQDDIKYFTHQKENRNPVFLNRFPGVDFTALKILDFGCGHGALSLDLADKGAKEVLGIDINCSLIDFAKENLAKNYGHLSGKVSYECIGLEKLQDNNFDIIISKASFEHIIGLERLLTEMKQKLKPGGRIVAGFGPLYNSPYGDHNRLKHPLPWSHVLLGEKHFIKKLNQKGQNIKSIHDLGLNGYSLKRYREIFSNTEGLALTDFRTNVSDKASMKFFNLMTHIPFLKEYFTYNIYCILERVK